MVDQVGATTLKKSDSPSPSICQLSPPPSLGMKPIVPFDNQTEILIGYLCGKVLGRQSQAL